MAEPDDIEARLAALRETYGEFPVESGTYYHSTTEFERVQDNHERGRPGASRVWVERDGETLLVRTRGGLDGWGVAGGFIEPDERSDEAGVREIREETGIDCEIIDVAYVHIAENRLDGDHETDPIEELAVAFIAEYVSGELAIQDEEIVEAEWWDEIPDESYPPASRIGTNRL
jgi:ADP-ribose pyrophosphatase YjhB (NUDIX family)